MAIENFILIVFLLEWLDEDNLNKELKIANLPAIRSRWSALFEDRGTEKEIAFNDGLLFSTPILSDQHLRKTLLKVLAVLSAKEDNPANALLERKYIEYEYFIKLRETPRRHIEDSIFNAIDSNWMYARRKGGNWPYLMLAEDYELLSYAESRILNGFRVRLDIETYKSNIRDEEDRRKIPTKDQLREWTTSTVHYATEKEFYELLDRFKWSLAYSAYESNKALAKGDPLDDEDIEKFYQIKRNQLIEEYTKHILDARETYFEYYKKKNPVLALFRDQNSFDIDEVLNWNMPKGYTSPTNSIAWGNRFRINRDSYFIKLGRENNGRVKLGYDWGKREGDKETIKRNNELLDRAVSSVQFPKGEDIIHDYLLFLTKNNMQLFTDALNTDKKTTTYFLKGLLDLFVSNPRQFERKKFLTHTYIVGQSGSGKSELLKTIIFHLNGVTKKKGSPCILIDPHGDLADNFDGEDNWKENTNIKKEVSFWGSYKKCWKIAPHESRFVVNPFDIDDKSPQNRELVAQEITQMILEMVADSGLSALMETISFPIIYTLLKLPYADFAMFADCIRPSTGQEKLEALAGLVEPHHRAIWADLCGDTYDTTKRSVFNRLQSFLNKRIIGETITGRDDFGRAMERTEQGENLIISLPIPAIGEQASQVLGRFFLTRLQIWAKRRQAIAEKDRYPVFLVVDEVQNFLSAETARTLDQFGRKFGLFMVLANQHIKQIEDSQLKGSILANCKNKMVGMSDKATRQALAGEMGLKAEDFEGLKAGYFWGKFGSSEALKFYARQIPRLTYQEGEDGKEIKPPRPYYAETKNEGESPNGWELVGFTDRGNFRLEGGERAENRKPKYDL